MWGKKRTLFLIHKDEIEKKLLIKPKKEIWADYNESLKCSYPTFVRLCNDYIGKKLVKVKQQKPKSILENEKDATNVTTKQKPKSIRPKLTGTKINFTPTPDPERIKKWITKPKK